MVVHTKLEAKVQRCVGIECVQSRHNIAQKVLGLLRADLNDETCRGAAGRYAPAAAAAPPPATAAHAQAPSEGGDGSAAAGSGGVAGASRSDNTSPATVTSATAAPEAAASWGVPACVDLRALTMPYVKDTDLYRGIELQ